MKDTETMDLKTLRTNLKAILAERERLAVLIRMAREEKLLAKDRAEYERLQNPDEPAYQDECCGCSVPF